ncbi:hypothetical protein FI667_g4366, partial [Globisporangium splendens]
MSDSDDVGIADRLVRVRHLRGTDNVLSGGARFACCDVLGNRAHEEHGFLGHERNVLAKPREVQVAEVVAIEQRLTLPQILDSLDERGCRAFAAATGPDECNSLLAWDYQTVVPINERVLSIRIGKGDIAQLQVTLDRLQNLSPAVGTDGEEDECPGEAECPREAVPALIGGTRSSVSNTCRAASWTRELSAIFYAETHCAKHDADDDHEHVFKQDRSLGDWFPAVPEEKATRTKDHSLRESKASAVENARAIVAFR